MSRGLHRPAHDPSDLPAWQLVLPPSGRFTHLTAAGLLDWWLPPVPTGLPVFAAQSRDEHRPRREGLHVTRWARPEPAQLVDGVRLDPPAHILHACARHLGLLDLVVLVDCALRVGACTLAELVIVAGQRRPGAPRLRQAVTLADHRSESPWETLLRVLHVVCGVEVEPQFVLREGDGSFVARADLWLVGTTTVHEYDGGDHLARSQQRRDLARSRRIGNQTWVRRGYTSRDVLHQAVAVIRDADLSLGRPHRPERVRAWHELLTDSTFTPSGQARLLARLGLDTGPTNSGHQRQRHADGARRS